jgi:CDP-diglyceride synthetase
LSIAGRRVGTGLVAGGVVIAVFGGDLLLGTHWGSALAITAVACGAVHEMYRMLEAAGLPAHRTWGTLALAAALLLRASAPDLGLTAHEARELSLGVFLLGFLGPVMSAVARADREVAPDPDAARRIGATALGLAYVGLTASFLLELRMLGRPEGGFEQGLELAFLLSACVKIGDAMAYFVGRTVGRTPLTPVSPKKTWEGSIASLVASVTVAVVFGLLRGHDLRVMAGFGVVVDLAGQGGDLLESWFKRVLGAKDSSKTFGEMGGFLDMADALLLAAPPAWLWAALLVARGG